MRDSGIVGERLAFGVPPDRQHELSFVTALQKYVTSLRTREIQRRLDQRDQHLFQHTAGVELACGLQEECERAQLGNSTGCLRRFPSLDLAEELAGRAGVGVVPVRIEDYEIIATHPELDAVAFAQPPALDLLSVHEGAMPAVLIKHIEVRTFTH